MDTLCGRKGVRDSATTGTGSYPGDGPVEPDKTGDGVPGTGPCLPELSGRNKITP